MVQTRAALKRKATAMPQHRPTPMDPTSQNGFAKRAKERDFYKSYGFDFIVRRPDYSKLLGGVSRRIREGGGPEWGFDVKDLKSFYWQMANLAAAWADQYLITDVAHLPESEIRRLISAANGFCVQMDWEELRTLLPPTAASTFGHILGELLIQLDIHERLFQNPFWYMDGKTGPDDQSEDPRFGRKLQYLFDRLYQSRLSTVPQIFSHLAPLLILPQPIRPIACFGECKPNAYATQPTTSQPETRSLGNTMRSATRQPLPVLRILC